VHIFYLTHSKSKNKNNNNNNNNKDNKLYAESQEKLHAWADIVNIFSRHIKMTSGFDKSAIINIRKGKVENQQR
jgi:hypothetical protein